MTYFRDIKHIPLRTYNQGVMAFNILTDEGEAASKAYMADMTPEEKNLVFALFVRIKKEGAEQVKKELMRTMPLQEEEAQA